MGTKDHREPTADALRFFGVVTASVSHELNNVNSTIEQIAGLLEDHLTALESGRELDPERLRNVYERIRRQTRRAADIIERLNRFAHTTDDPRTRFEVQQLLENLVGLCQRLAQQQRIELRMADGGDEIWIEGDPFELARTIVSSLEKLWTSSPAGSMIDTAVVQEGEQAMIRFTGPLSAVPDGGAPPEMDGEPSQSLVSVDSGISGDRRIITIAVPMKVK